MKATRAFAVLACLSLASCGGVTTATVVPVAVDVADFACTELAKEWQNEPGWVKFICNAVGTLGDAPDAGGDAGASIVVVKVPAEQAPAFRARHFRGPVAK